MLDIVFIAIIVIFFAVALGYTRATQSVAVARSRRIVVGFGAKRAPFERRTSRFSKGSGWGV